MLEDYFEKENSNLKKWFREVEFSIWGGDVMEVGVLGVDGNDYSFKNIGWVVFLISGLRDNGVRDIVVFEFSIMRRENYNG